MTARSTATGLVKYDAMCTAIAVCSKVDEAKEIRDKARALEVYAQQALNTEAERKAGEIRLRAERRAGELLREMKQNGGRQKQAQPSKDLTSRQPTLNDFGISRDQSSQWQQLAEIPEKEFEAEISKPGPKPTTEGLLNSRRQPPDQPRIDPRSLWVWGRVKDFDRDMIHENDAAEICAGFTDFMREDVERILPALIYWLTKLAESCNDRLLDRTPQ